MMINTQNKPRDISLKKLISNLQQKITDTGFNIIESTYHIPAINRWSVHIRDKDCLLVHSYGQGSSKEVAMLNALEVFIGCIATHYFLSKIYFGDEISKSNWVHSPQELWFLPDALGSWPMHKSNEILNAELRRFYNPNNELDERNLIDIHSSNPKRGICCLPYTCLNSNETLYFPVNVITNLYSTNGMSVGYTHEEAQLNSLCDIIKNYVKFKVIANGLCLPNIPKKVLNHYSEVSEICNPLKESHYSLSIKDASLGGQYPVVNAVLINKQNQHVSMCFGAHPVFEIALEQALNELIKNHFIDKKPSYEVGFDMDEISSPQNLADHFHHANGIVSWTSLKNEPDFEYKEWNKQLTEDTKLSFTHLCDVIHSAGHDIYSFNYQAMGSYVSNIIIPSMSEVYPIDDLIWENDNMGMYVRQLLLKQNKTVEECEQLILDLEELGVSDEILISDIIGMPSDSKSVFEDLTLNELITLLALKTQDNERIQEGCEWLLHFKKIQPHRLKVYHCINLLLQLDKMLDYSTSLGSLYPKDVLNDALALLDGEDVFHLESEWNLYQSLIDSYKKVIN